MIFMKIYSKLFISLLLLVSGCSKEPNIENSEDNTPSETQQSVESDGCDGMTAEECFRKPAYKQSSGKSW